MQLTRLHSRIRSTNLEVFSIHPNSGKFIVALGEAIYHFTCPKMLLRPIFLNDGRCFNNLAVKKLQKDFIISNTTLFLTPFERFITESPGELPCTKEFSTKFELADGKWIAVDKNGMHDIPEPSKELTWLENEHIYKNTIDNVIFDLGKGLYSFNDIKRYNKLITFSGRRSTTVGKLTQQMHPDVFQDPNFGQIEPKHMFKQFQRKKYISNALEKFGRYASIAVAIWTMIAMVKSLVNWCNGIWLVKKLTGSHKQTAKFALSPSYFLIQGLGQRNKPNFDQEDSIIRNKINVSDQHALDKPTHPMTDNNTTLVELKRLNEKLPVYQQY